jgi:superoxide reductase
MHRREFAKSTLIGMAAVAALPVAAQAAMGDPNENVIFTESDPGHWAKVVKLHVPETSVADGKLTVRTPHPQSEPHYIVSHTVVLADGTFLSRKTFTYKDEPVSEHALPAGYSGRLTVTSTCNQHDWWTKTVTI